MVRLALILTFAVQLSLGFQCFSFKCFSTNCEATFKQKVITFRRSGHYAAGKRCPLRTLECSGGNFGSDRSDIEAERRRLLENVADIQLETQRRIEEKEQRDGEATQTLKREFASYSDEENKAGFLKGATNPLRLRRQTEADSLNRMDTETDGVKSEVPTDIQTAMTQAQEALAYKLASGSSRIRCDLLVPGLNPVIEDRFPYDEGLMCTVAFTLAQALSPRTVTLLFDSAGAAAGARARLARAGPVPPTYRFGAIASTRVTRDSVGADGRDVTPDVAADNATDVYLVVRPKNSRGDSVVLAVEQAVGKVPAAVWVLLNPLLEDTVDSYTFGIGETDRRREAVRQFDQCYYLRGLFVIRRPSMIPSERGCVVMRADYTPAAAETGAAGRGQWRVYQLAPGGFELMRCFDRRPSRSDLDALPW